MAKRRSFSRTKKTANENVNGINRLAKQTDNGICLNKKSPMRVFYVGLF